jgi:hypothetical protein
MDETIQLSLTYKIIYNTTYAVSYNLVFSVMFLAKSIPTNNAFINGILDGANAANDKIKSIKKI